MFESFALALMAFWTLLEVRTRTRRPIPLGARCVTRCGKASRTEI